MNIIKGLIVKDLLQLKSYRKTLIIFIVIMFIFSIMNQQQTEMINMFSMMLILGFGMFGIATFSYDEMSKADKYIMTLPITRKQIVLSKYIMIIGATTIGGILGGIISFAIYYIINQQIIDIQNLLYILIGEMFGIGLIQAIEIPCIYKYGAEKGRFFVFFITFLIAFLIGGIFYIYKKIIMPMGNFNFIKENLNFILENYIGMLLIASTTIFYWVSYIISKKIYCKKEL